MQKKGPDEPSQEGTPYCWAHTSACQSKPITTVRLPARPQHAAAQLSLTQSRGQPEPNTLCFLVGKEGQRPLPFPVGPLKLAWNEPRICRKGKGSVYHMFCKTQTSLLQQENEKNILHWERSRCPSPSFPQALAYRPSTQHQLPLGRVQHKSQGF